MTTPVEAWFEKAYIKGATHKLQSQGFLLKGTTREPDRVQAKEVVWRVAGRGEASRMSDTIERARPMNAGRDVVQGTLTDWQAPDWIRHPDINKMSENEQDIVQQTAAMALGRRFDRLHFDEFDAQGASIHTVGDGNGTIALTDVMTAAGRIIGRGILGVPELFCPLPEKFFNQLLLYKQFSNADYVGPEYPLARMTMRKKWGFVTYFLCPNELFTYDTGAGPDAWETAQWCQTYMWHKSAVGFATNYEMQSRITWENQYTAYFANNWMSGCCKVILPEGVERLKFKFNGDLVDPDAPPSSE